MQNLSPTPAQRTHLSPWSHKANTELQCNHRGKNKRLTERWGSLRYIREKKFVEKINQMPQSTEWLNLYGICKIYMKLKSQKSHSIPRWKKNRIAGKHGSGFKTKQKKQISETSVLFYMQWISGRLLICCILPIPHFSV